jgi:hypothetical protein
MGRKSRAIMGFPPPPMSVDDSASKIVSYVSLIFSFSRSIRPACEIGDPTVHQRIILLIMSSQMDNATRESASGILFDVMHETKVPF